MEVASDLQESEEVGMTAKIALPTSIQLKLNFESDFESKNLELLCFISVRPIPQLTAVNLWLSIGPELLQCCFGVTWRAFQRQKLLSLSTALILLSSLTHTPYRLLTKTPILS